MATSSAYGALAILPPTVKDLWTGNGTGIALGIQLAAALMPFFVALCGLLGYIAMDTSRRTTAAAAGGEIPTVLGGIFGAIGRR